MEYGLIDEIVGMPGTEEDPAVFVAAAGSRIRLTAAMRQRYQDHLLEDRRKAEDREKATRALAKLRHLQIIESRKETHAWIHGKDHRSAGPEDPAPGPGPALGR